jgi:hypothetical protein
MGRVGALIAILTACDGDGIAGSHIAGQEGDQCCQEDPEH